MTLPTSTRVTDPYETDGVQRDFEFDFPAFYNADTGHYGIEVRRLTALDYEVIDKSLYDIFLNDEDKSGYVRFHVAPMAGDDIYIAGDTTRSQQLNLINYGRYSAQSIEKAFDLIVALIQEFVSKVDEETRQRILADQALRDFLLIKFNQFTAEVTTKIDKHIGDINGFMSSLIPMFVCIMRKEIAYYAETQLDGIIDAKLSDLSIQVANAINENDAALIRLNESIQKIDAATTATAIAARLFDTPAAGVHPVTGVAVGSYFNVRSPNTESYVDEYQNVGGSAVATGKSYPSAAFVQDVKVKAPYFFNTVPAMVSANNISDGMIVGTKGYHNIFDDGGAIYLISSTATNYSIPLANGLHAVFRDTFDIRKFGIISSPTVRQDANLIRMRNYADSREYVIDFLGFDIVTPNENAGIKPGHREDVANGLWFEYAHHYKNLSIYNDKSERLETGKCCLIFCPTKNPDQLTTVIFENINLDPWNDNYQPFTENYLGAYDGMRHGIFCHPKTGWNSIPKSNDKYRCLNFIFKFININFISQAYSYNITTSALRAKAVYVDGLYGDAFLGINVDCYDYFAKNTQCTIRGDRLEAGRQMVLSCHHFEPELSNQGVFNRGIVKLENCHTQRLNADTVVTAGQTLWIADLVATHTEMVEVSNSSGSFEFQISTSGSTYREVLFYDCPIHEDITTFVGFSGEIVVERFVVRNADWERQRSNSGYNSFISTTAEVKHAEWDNCRFPSGSLSVSSYNATTLPQYKLGKVVLRGCHTPITNITGVLTALFNCTIEIIGGDYAGGTIVYRGTDILSLKLQGVGTRANSSISMRYTDVSKSTQINAVGGVFGGSLELRTSGKTTCSDMQFSSTGTLNIIQPYEGDYSGGFSAGIATNTNITSNIIGESYIKDLAINRTVAANSAVKVTTSVNKFCKDVLFNLTSADLITSTSISGTTATISLFNPTASPIVVNETVALKMIV